MTTKHALDQDPPACPGEWRRPRAGEHRSPCPALNSLANGGYLPRGGLVTSHQLIDALSGQLGAPRSMATLLAKVSMAQMGAVGPDGVERLDLEALCRHGIFEHDASLTRRDARHGDAARLAPQLLAQLVSLSEDGRTLTLEDIATAHQLRMTQSAADGHGVPFKASVLGTVEAAVLYVLLRRDGAIALSDLRDFFENERVPARRGPGALGWGRVLITAAQLVVMGNVPFFRTAERARRIALRRLAATPHG
jgi:hypothetical protein